MYLPLQVHAQVKFIVTDIPQYTPKQADIYLVGSFNNWDPSDEKYKLTYQADSNYYTYLFTAPLTAFEYKFTRGKSWDYVETSPDGFLIQNRVYIAYQDVKDTTIYCQISTWKDMAAETTFEIKLLPENTPTDASIYITGSFNKWKSPDPQYKLTLKDEVYSITLPSVYDTFSYKFTRGDWKTVEGGPNGGFRPNRLYEKASDKRDIVPITILSWEDLTENVYTFSSFFLLLSAALALIMIAVISSIKHKNQSVLRPLFILLLLYSLGIVSRILFDSKEVFALQPKLYLVPELVIFLFGPIYLLFTKALLKRSIDPEPNLQWWWFIPFAIQLLTYAPWLILSPLEFSEAVIDRKVEMVLRIIGITALLFNSWICFKSFRLIRKAATFDEEAIPTYKLAFANSLQTVFALGLLLWLFTFILGIFNHYTVIEFESYFYVNFGIKMIWMIFGLSSYVVTYFAVKYPELIRKNPSKVEKSIKPYVDEQYTTFQKKLEKQMEEEKIFLNPQLTIQELAQELGTNSHTLSRIINDSYQKNFNEYINTYRIKEFIRVVLLNKHQENFSTLALEVGFNSKPTFNRAFKKVTGMTPRAYFKQKKGEE